MTMTETGLPSIAVHLVMMSPGINTVWEFLMTGGGLVLWLAAVYTVYRLAKWGYRSLRGEPVKRA